MNNFPFPLQLRGSAAPARFAAPLGRKSEFFVLQKDPISRRCECELPAAWGAEEDGRALGQKHAVGEAEEGEEGAEQLVWRPPLVLQLHRWLVGSQRKMNKLLDSH